MPFKYRALTANCGNDAIGTEASKEIARQLKGDEPDFYVLNCQEVDFEKTLKQLQAAVGPEYTVAISPKKMATHTKASTQVHHGTGIATFVIHKKELEVTFIESQITRRNPSRLAGGGYNKGGLVSDIKIKNPAGESIKIQAVSGHLDSTNTAKRSQDWLNLNRAINKKIFNWDELVKACPHLRLSGYDANTRNKKGEPNINLWESAPKSPEMQALYQAAIASKRFSGESTYKTHIGNITEAEDKKRPGYVRGGMLDFVDIADGGISDPDIQTHAKGVDVVQIKSKEGEGRDHDVIMSPLESYDKARNQEEASLLDFERVKGQMAARLAQVAPELAQEISGLAENDENKAKLVKVYQRFLNPDGLLNKALELHIHKLKSINQTIDFSNINDDLKQRVINTLFPSTPWFESATLGNMEQLEEKFVQKMKLTKLLISSLNSCQSQASFERKLRWYNGMMQMIEPRAESPAESPAATYTSLRELQMNSSPVLARQSSPEAGLGAKSDIYTIAKKSLHNDNVDECLENYMSFLSKLPQYAKNNDSDQKDNFRDSFLNVINQINHIANITENDINHIKEKLTALDPQSLSQLNRVLETCDQAIYAIENNNPDIKPISQKLANLSQEISGKASPKWQALGKGLLFFACAALVVTGVLAAIPTGGSSLLLAAAGINSAALFAGSGIAVLDSSSAKGLAKSVSHYKEAIKDLHEDQERNEDTPPTPR